MNDFQKSENELAFVQGNDSSSSLSDQDGHNINYNQNNNNLNNPSSNAIRDEQKQAAVLLSGEFESLYYETKIMIKQKQYKKVLSLLEQYRPEKGLSVSQKILINRRMIVSSNKILKLYSYDIDVESDDKIMQLIERTVKLISESYRFLNLYICKILPNILNDAFLNDASHLTSDDENDRFPIKRIKTAFESLHSYDLVIKKDKEKEEKQAAKEAAAAAAASGGNGGGGGASGGINGNEKSGQGKQRDNIDEKNYKLLNDRFNQPILTDDKIYKMINERNNSILDIGYELDQYIIQLLQYFLRVSNIYKRSHKYKISFFYLKEANRIVDEVCCYHDPEIIHLCAKIRLTISNFYFEANRVRLAIDYSENAIFLMQFEYRLRICDKQPNVQITKKENGRQMNCIKAIIIALINLSLFYEAINDYKRLFETCQLAEFISVKFLKGIDEVKKYMSKIFQEVNKRYDNYLTELGELDLIARSILWKEANSLSKQWDENVEQQNNNFLSQFDEKFYEKFKLRDLNQLLKVKIKKHEKQYISYEHMDKIKFQKMKNKEVQDKIEQSKLKDENGEYYNGGMILEQDMNSQNEKQFSSEFRHSGSLRESQQSSWQQFQNQSQSQSIQSKNNLNTESSVKNRLNTEEKLEQLEFKSPKSQSIQFKNLPKINEDSQDEDVLKEDIEMDSKSLGKDQKQQQQSQQQGSQSQSNINDKQTNITQSDDNNNNNNSQESDISFYDLGASFFYDNEFEDNWKSQQKSSIQQVSSTNSVQNRKAQPNPDQQQQQMSQKKYIAIDPSLLKKKPPAIKQYPPDFKSKVLTSNDYFNPYVRQVTPKKALKTIIDESIEKYQKLLRYPRNAEEFNVKYLEEHIRNIVVDKVEQEKIKDINQAYEHFDALLSRDEMDKKRFEFSRKIVHLKIFRDLNPKLKDQYNDLYFDHKLEIERNGEFQLLLSQNMKEMERLKQFKKERNVDLVIDKGYNVDLTDEMTKALESKLQEKKKKKSLRETIFKYNDNEIFAQAKNLKTVYQNYLGQLREIERTERLKKEQLERDKHKEEEMKYNEQQKQILNNQDSSEQLSQNQNRVQPAPIHKQSIQAYIDAQNLQEKQQLQQQLVLSQLEKQNQLSQLQNQQQQQQQQLQSQSNIPQSNSNSQQFLSQQPQQQQQLNQYYLGNNSPKSQVSILKQNQSASNIAKKSIYLPGQQQQQQQQPQKQDKILSFQQGDEKKYNIQDSYNTQNKSKQSSQHHHNNNNSNNHSHNHNQTQKNNNNNNNKDIRIRNSHSTTQILYKDQKEIRNIIDTYQDPEDRKKCFKRVPQYKQTFRNSLYDMNLCKFDKAQKEEEIQRQKMQEEERIKYLKELENRMMYYGSSNMYQTQQPEIYMKSTNLDELSKTLQENSYTKTEQRKKLQYDELYKKEKRLFEKQKALLKSQSQSQFNSFGGNDTHLQSQLKNKSSQRKQKDSLHQFQTAQTTPKEFEFQKVKVYDPQYQREVYRDQNYFKQCSDKVIKIVATDVERNLKETYDEHFKIKYKVEKKKDYVQELNFGRKFVKKFSRLRWSTFSTNDQYPQLDKPKNMIDITKMKLKQNLEKNTINEN